MYFYILDRRILLNVSEILNIDMINSSHIASLVPHPVQDAVQRRSDFTENLGLVMFVLSIQKG